MILPVAALETRVLITTATTVYAKPLITKHKGATTAHQKARAPGKTNSSGIMPIALTLISLELTPKAPLIIKP